tara:strand:+ start:860 stop:1180 length:321 start_codon:yes stop_codon:yes gene_type:complete
MAAASGNQNSQMANEASSVSVTTSGQSIPTPSMQTYEQANSEDRAVAEVTIEFDLDEVKFNDVAPSIIDLSNDENIITIDARAIVYKEEPFKEVINTEFKTYPFKG